MRAEVSAPGGSQRSAFVQLRHSPRFFAFMGAMLLGATSLGASAVAKLEFATQMIGNEIGIGALSIVAALGGAVMGLPAGVMVDRFGPRRILLGVFAVMACVHFGTAMFLSAWTPHFSVFIVLSFIEGMMVSVGAPSVAAAQAALVPKDARGAGEIINLFRLSIGAIIGTLIAASLGRPALTLMLCGLMAAAVAVVFWLISRPVAFPRVEDGPLSMRAFSELFDRVRRMPLLRQTVIADLVLRFVIPTQLVNLFIVDKGAMDVAGFVILGGVIGVAIGNLSLGFTGLSGRLDRRMRFVFVGYLVNMIIGSLLMIDDYLVSHVLLLVVIVILGSGLSTYSQGLLAAMIQQRSPDDIRGRLTGGLTGARMLLVAAGVVMATFITSVYFTQVFSWTLAILGVIALVVLRGFSRIGASV